MILNLGNNFNELIMIDSTYNIVSKRSNRKKDNTCLALITCINKYGRTCALAAAIMTSENAYNYSFLLCAYESVGFRRPQTVLTDQHTALISSIKANWPNVNHHLCLFHVYRDVQKRLGIYF